jgi:hypothetical protein
MLPIHKLWSRIEQKCMQISNEGFWNVHSTIIAEELHDVFL